jgi:hypothetical protein
VTGYRLKCWSLSPGRVKNFLFSTLSRPALSLGVKQQKLDADHSPPTSAEVRKMWICTSTPPYGIVLNYLNTGTALLLL